MVDRVFLSTDSSALFPFQSMARKSPDIPTTSVAATTRCLRPPGMSLSWLRAQLQALLAEQGRVKGIAIDISEFDMKSGDLAERASSLEGFSMLSCQGQLEGEKMNEVDEALDRIRLKTYGQCMSAICKNGGWVKLSRLEALPWARTCIGCDPEVGTAIARAGHSPMASGAGASYGSAEEGAGDDHAEILRRLKRDGSL